MNALFRRWLGKIIGRRKARGIHCARRVLPGFEELEDRTLPSGGFPYVESINRTTPAGPVTNATSVSYTVTFSEAVTGVAASDFQLALGGTATGTVSQVTAVSGAVYTVTASGVSGNGTLGLNLLDNGSIRDLADNPLTRQNAPAAFQTQQTFDTGYQPTSVATGDLNGDGKLDLVVASNGDNTVSVLMGNGNGTFQARQTIAMGYDPVSVVVADLNGDGKPDIVLANYNSANVGVLLGNGNGTFQTQQTFATAYGPASIAVGDVNGDGIHDIIVANRQSNTVSVLLGNGNGSFQGQQTFTTSSKPTAVALGDVNGDGKPDIVVTDAGNHWVSVLLGNGNGTFQTQQTFTAGDPSSLALGDINSDGNLDCVVSNSPVNNVDLLLGNGNGNGTFQVPQALGVGGAAFAVALEDVNGDGTLDLVLSELGSLSVLLGNGNGTFQAPQSFATGVTPRSLALGDVNGDGRPDLIVANFNNNSVSVLLNSGNGNFTGQLYTTTTAVTTNLAFSGLPSAATVHSGFGFTLTALDSSNNPAVGYTGTVHFSTSPGAGSLVPADYTFTPADSGVHVFSAGAILVSPGTQTITAFDTAITALSASASVSVVPEAATRLAVDAPSGVIPDTAFNFTVTALDQFGNTATAYSGTVDIACSDTHALFPISTTLTNGLGIFSATLKTPGKQTLTATDSSNTGIAGSATINAVNPIGIGPFVQSINRTTPAAELTNASTVTCTVTFSQPVIGVNLSDFALIFTGTVSGTLTQVTPLSGAVYTVAVSAITGIGTLGLNLVDNESIFNLAGNPLTLMNSPAVFTVNAPQKTFATVMPSQVVLGDVNGDGIPDLLVANDVRGQAYAVGVLLGNGNGTFQAQQTFAAGRAPVAVAIGDVNGDGKPDLVVANYSGDSVGVLFGNGNGTFQAQLTFATEQSPISVALGDVNGDGKPDIVVANFGYESVSVLLGNGNGTFQTQQTFATEQDPTSVTLANLTGDGNLDIVVADKQYDAVSVLLGNGNGTFHAQETFATGFKPSSVAVGDVNGDGRPDLVVANAGSNVLANAGSNALANTASNTVSVLLGNGNGTFQAQQTFATGVYPTSVALADVNGDGKPDVLVANSASNTLGVLLGNGNGTFQAQQMFAAGYGPSSLVAGDLTVDGKLDVAIGDQDTHTVSVLLGNGDGTFQVQLIPGTGNYPGSMVLTDVNGDGKPDVVVANHASNTVSVLLGNGNGTFQPQKTFAAGDEPELLAVADMNGDGKPDILLSNDYTNSVSVLLGNGNGSFQAPQTFTAGYEPSTVLEGDFNGDGHPDLVVGSNLTKTLALVLGNSNGTFQAPQTFATGINVLSMAVGDVNNDGKLDLIVTTNTATVDLFLGNGNGTFKAGQTIGTGADPVAPIVADLNGDGKPDIAFINYGFTAVSILVGNGNGTFQNGLIPFAGNGLSGLAIGDVNGDGKQDIAVFSGGNSLVESLSLLLGNGNGTFRTPQSYTANQFSALALGDANGDGKPDIVMADDAGNTVNVWLNSTNGNFAGQIYAISPTNNFAITGLPATALTRSPLTFTLTALDPNNNTVAGYTGTVHFSSTDTAAGSVVPADYTFVPADGGVHVFAAGAILVSPGVQTITATDSAINLMRINASVLVVPTSLAISGMPTTVVAGTTFTFTVTAQDPSHNTVPGYTGTVHFTKTDPGGSSSLPADYTFLPADGGIHVFTAGAILTSVGIQTITATDTSISTLSDSASVSVIPGPATYFMVKAPAQVIPNAALRFTVTDQDQFGNTATAYAGTVGFSSSDSQALLPINSTLTYGVGVFSATLKTPGKQTLTATDSSNAAITGMATIIAVNAVGIAPFVLYINRTSSTGAVTDASTVTFTTTFSQTVTGVNLSDFALALTGTATGTLTRVTPVSGSVYTVTVSGITGIGTLGLNLVDNGGICNLAGNPLTQQNATAAFQPQQTFAVGVNPRSVEIGDLTGDGILDVVVANQVSNSVSVLLGNGNGTFQTQQTFAVGGNPVAVALGDINGDGISDIVVADYTNSANSVSVLLGNGNGTFQPFYQVNSGGFPDSVALADVNGDGKPDIVVANANGAGASGSVNVLLGDGNGTFQTPRGFRTAFGPLSLIIGDVNGDGKPDIVVADQYSLAVSVLLGNGNGTFQAQRTFYAYVGPHALALGDVNGDGVPDIVVTNNENNNDTVALLQGNGDGTFEFKQVITTGLIPLSVALVDVTGDGNLDIVTANEASKTVSVLRGNGNGTFQAQQTFATGLEPVSVAVGDLNGDGRPDLVLANEDSNTVSVLLNSANGDFTGQTYAIISPAVTTQFVVSAAPALVAAGNRATLTVTAQDQVNEVSYAYTGTVHFSTTDVALGVSLPPDYAFVPSDNGVHVFTADLTLVTLGSQTLTVSDTSNGSITGNAVLSVTTPVASHLTVSATAGDVAGVPIKVTVTAENPFGNTATNYTGTVQFTSSDSNTLLPPSATLTAGVGVFTATLITAGTQTLTVTDTANSSLTGTSGFITVAPTTANHFAISAPSSVSAGTPFAFTITAEDPFDNLANYTATLRFTSSDQSASLPTNSTLTGGAGTFSATLSTFGSQTISVFDAAAITVYGRSAPITVTAPATHFVISAPSSTTAGSVFIYAVTATDALGNTAEGYAGIVHISSSDAQASLSADATLTGGIGFFAAALRTAGHQTLIATDTINGSLSGTSAAIAVTAVAANHFALSAPAAAITGIAANFTVTAKDPYNNTATGYAGTVHFTSSDASAALPADTTLTGGVGVFSATLKSVGSQTLTATDVANTGITGTSNAIATRGLTVASLTPTPTGFVATFDKPFDPSLINLYDANGNWGPDDVLLTGPGAPQISIHGSLMVDPTDTTITFVKTSDLTGPNFNPATGVLAAGTYTVTLRSANNGFKDLLGVPLDGANTGNVAGSNYIATFVVTAPPVVVGLPSFARGPDSNDAVNLPAGATTAGIPINVSNGTGVTSGKFTLMYNSALLTIAGANVNSSLAGASLSLDSSSTAGTAILDFSSPTPLAASTAVVRLGGLVAFVPNSAIPLYKSKALLHWSGVQLNTTAGPIPVEGDDAIEVVAYLGDTNGDGTLSGGDGANISSVNSATNAATNTLGGFSAYPLADPTIIGDLNNNGNADSADVTLLNSYLSGTPHAQIPLPPAALAGFTVTGPDPALSLPTTLQAPLGGTVVVPVNIDDAHPDGSTGATEAILALKFNPQIFSVSAADVQLGSLPAASKGWQLTTQVNSQTGEIGIDLFGGSPIQSTASGSLVLISLHVRETAPVGPSALQLVNQLNPTCQRAFVTTMGDGQGAFILHQAATATGTEPGEPGLVMVTGGWSGLVSGPSPVEGNQSTASRGQLIATGVSDLPATVRSQVPTAYFLEQIFGDIDSILAQHSVIAQPGVILNTGLNEQTSISGQDKAMLEPLVDTQNNWMSAELLQHFFQVGQDGVDEADGAAQPTDLPGK